MLTKAAAVIRNVTIPCYHRTACNVILTVQGLEHSVSTALDKNLSFRPGVFPKRRPFLMLWSEPSEICKVRKWLCFCQESVKFGHDLYFHDKNMIKWRLFKMIPQFFSISWFFQSLRKCDQKFMIAKSVWPWHNFDILNITLSVPFGNKNVVFIDSSF